MHILVTGGAGFVGTNLIKQLLKEGHDIISIDNYSTGKKENHIDKVKYIEGDIYNLMDHIATLSTPYYQPDVVFHMAAIARIQPSFENPQDYIKTNFNGTYNIVQFCTNREIPLIYAGSSSHHSGKFKNPYTFSKDLGEEIIQLYQKHFGLKASITRFYNVYGPHQLEEGDYSTVIGIFERQYRNNEPLTITSTGEQRRDFTHVNDIIDGLYKCANKNFKAEVFELGRGKNFSINEIVDMFGAERKYIPARKGEYDVTLCTDTKAQEMLGWNPIEKLEDYIKKIIK